MKKILQKILKFFLIIIVTIKNLILTIFSKSSYEENIFDESSSESGATKTRKVYIGSVDDGNVILTLNVISKQINKLQTELTLTKEEKKEIIIKLQDRLNIIETKNDNIKPTNKITEIQKEQIDNKIKKNKTILNEYAHNNKISLPIQKENTKNTKKIKEEVKEKNDREKYIQYIKDSNNILKEAKTSLKEIEEEIKENKRLDNNIYRIEDIKEKIKRIRENYYEFKHNRYIYEIENDSDLKDLDTFEIIKNSTNIDNYLKKCNILLERIEEYKKHSDIVNIKKENKQKKEEIKKQKVEAKEEKIEEKEKKPKLLQEIEQASNIISKHITRQQKMLDELEENISKKPSFERRKVRLNFFDNILNNTLRIGLTFLPFKMIRNRKLGLLITGFLLNNNIRTMRKVLAKDVMCDYVTLARYIKTETEITNSYERICNDSLYQISMLKDEFIRHYGYAKDSEISKIYMKLENLEGSIINEIDRINEAKIQIEKVKKIGDRR
ncbi:MAG: hypothetical protein IJ565_02075 [Bacilli bacterium]|nr:hypothetical protein [Bacilli bacterium]